MEMDEHGLFRDELYKTIYLLNLVVSVAMLLNTVISIAILAIVCLPAGTLGQTNTWKNNQFV